jgi:hypothetical protein
MSPSPFRPLFALAILVPAVACGQDDPRPVPPSVAEAFPEILLPPNSEFVSRSGGEGALTLTLRTSEPYAMVLGYYRAVLGREPWRIRSDSPDADSGRILYAERAGRPVWVQLRSDGSGATLVDLTGAAAKPSAVAPPPAADTVPRPGFVPTESIR